MTNAPAPTATIPTCSLDEMAGRLGRDIPEKFRRHLQNWTKFYRGGPPYLADLFAESDPATQPWLVVIDTEHEDAQNIRLVGTAIADFFGSDATGFDFLQTVTPEIKAVFVDAHRRINRDLVGKFHLAVCSTSTGRELEVLAFALPYRRKDDLPCAAWLLFPGTALKYGETGSQVRSILAQFWIDLPAA
ncbi:MAG: hypothetical protein K1X51_14720 [Rhodospirillaceae bacterium]|nr:hypothetical protein [Rhodospirillaceae bacterium]